MNRSIENRTKRFVANTRPLWGWLSGLLVGWTCALGLWFGLLLLAHGLPWSPDALYLHSWRERKAEAISKDGPPRLLILGGSGAFYGIRASVLEEKLGLPVFNLATHAGLPLNFLLKEAMDHLRPGDTALMAWEYEFYTPAGNDLNEVCLKYLVAHEPEFLSLFPWQEQVGLLLAAKAEVVTPWLWSNRSSIRKEQQRLLEESRTTVETTGDRWLEERREINLSMQESLAVTDAGSLSNPAAQYLTPPSAILDFLAWCEERQISVVATYPNIMQHESYEDDLARSRLLAIRISYTELGVPFVGESAEAMLPLSHMYDTIYHPNAVGSLERTKRLAEHLQKYFSSLDK